MNPTPTPALRSALWNHLHVEHGLTLLESELDEIIIKAQVAPAPVEQAAQKAAEAVSLVQRPVGFRKEDWDEYRARTVEAIMPFFAHFQSLATEKPTSSPGETGGEAKGQSAIDELVDDAHRALDEAAQTPMTDKAAFKCVVSIHGNCEVVRIEFARTLETALAAAKERGDRAERALALAKTINCTFARFEDAEALALDRDALAEKLRRVEGERDEETRKLKEQFDLYCAETKRHNETWAQIHAATAYMDKECKNLPDGLMEKVREVFFRMTPVEMGRDELRDKCEAAYRLARQPDQRQSL